MRIAMMALGIAAVLLCGCQKQYDSKVNVASDVGSGPFKMITRPVGSIVSVLLGEGIVVNEIREVRTPEGFLEVQVGGYNESMYKKQFDYKPEWLDANGMVVESVMSKWVPTSVPAKSTFHFKVTAPSVKAVDYRINTRLNKTMDK